LELTIGTELGFWSVELDKKKEGDQTNEKKLGSGIIGQVLNFVIGRLLEEPVIGPV
jgi:hypothetical protein